MASRFHTQSGPTLVTGLPFRTAPSHLRPRTSRKPRFGKFNPPGTRQRELAENLTTVPSDILTRMWKTLALVVLAIVAAQDVDSQVPCPVSLTSADAEQDRIQLEFMNKGKLPIEQIGLSCMPSVTGKPRRAICHHETGIFYPGTESWIQIAYPGANRHNIDFTGSSTITS